MEIHIFLISLQVVSVDIWTLWVMAALQSCGLLSDYHNIFDHRQDAYGGYCTIST